MAALLLGSSLLIASTTALGERDAHTFGCVAALDARADDLARQVKAGQTELRPLLVTTLEAGAAFIGNAYLQGDRDEARSQERLAVALQAQRTLSDIELAARQASCAQEGARLLTEADLLGRLVISRLVQRRLQKVLEN